MHHGTVKVTIIDDITDILMPSQPCTYESPSKGPSDVDSCPVSLSSKTLTPLPHACLPRSGVAL